MYVIFLYAKYFGTTTYVQNISILIFDCLLEASEDGLDPPLFLKRNKAV